MLEPVDKTAAIIVAKDTEEEVAALVRQLHETQRRLQELGGGELDAVLHPGGQSYLLHDAQERLRKSEAMQRDLAATQSAILNALPAHVALLDHEGIILSVNDGWKKFAKSNGFEGEGFGVGRNYLEVCDSASGDRTEYSREAAAGIRAVLNGGTRAFAMEYPCHSPTERCWFRLMVNRMAADGVGGAVVMHVNITERKAAGEQLIASEALLRQFIRHAPAAIAMLDTEMRYIQTSDRWIQDYHLSGEDITGKCHYDVFPDAPERWKEIHQRSLAGAIERCDEDPFPRSDGSIDWLQWEVRPWYQAGGQIGGLIFFTQVITEQKRSRDSLLLFKTLIDHSGDAIEVLDADTLRFLDFNESACQRLGYSREELLSMSASDIDLEVNPSLWKQRGIELQTLGAITFEARHQRKDGSTFPVEVSLKRVQLDRNYVVAAVRDITERKRIEARFHRLVDSDVQGVFFWNTKGEISGGNDAFLKLVGYGRDDLEARRIDWVAMTPPEYADGDRKALAELAAKGVCAPYEKEWICRDGSRVFVLLGAATFEDSPTEGVCFAIDLTERKKLERQFLQVQRMESIGTLAGGIAHDLNNTLSPIIMSLDILASQATDPDSERLLEILSASARRGANMVRQVLTFARGVEGERREMQLKHLVHEIENIVRDTFPKNIRMSSNIPNNLWTILGDATQIHQVLLNLCVNARDAMPTGGKITVSAENLNLDEHYAGLNPDANPGAYISVQVEDNGSGIDPANIGRIFDPFFTTKEIDKGTRAGTFYHSSHCQKPRWLPTSLTVSWAGERGSRFILPAQIERAQGTAGNEPVTLPHGHGELILVVDDEEAVRLVTQRTLEVFQLPCDRCYRWCRCDCALRRPPRRNCCRVDGRDDARHGWTRFDSSSSQDEPPVADHRCERHAGERAYRQGRDVGRETFPAETVYCRNAFEDARRIAAGKSVDDSPSRISDEREITA